MTNANRWFWTPALIAVSFSLPAQETHRISTRGEYLVYAGTYTGPQSKGIYAFRFQPATGKVTSLGLVAETVNPSFVVLHRKRRLLYAVNETPTREHQSSGSVSAFSVDTHTGQMTRLNQVSSRGDAPASLTLDRTGNWVIAANYNGGSVAVFPVKADGRLGEASSFVQHSGASVHARQKGPHPHQTVVSPDNRYVLVPDLGLDQVVVYRFDATKGALTPNDPPAAKVSPGSGPRHLTFHPNGRFVFLLNEITSTVSVFSYDAARGTLEGLQTIPALPAGFSQPSSAAEIEVDRTGTFLYASLRGPDEIVMFAVDSKTGMLSLKGRVATQGKAPRHFAIDPAGAYLLVANQNSGNIVFFRIDRKTGDLTPTGTVLDVPSPVCITFLEVP